MGKKVEIELLDDLYSDLVADWLVVCSTGGWFLCCRWWWDTIGYCFPWVSSTWIWKDVIWQAGRQKEGEKDWRKGLGLKLIERGEMYICTFIYFPTTHSLNKRIEIELLLGLLVIHTRGDFLPFSSSSRFLVCCMVRDNKCSFSSQQCRQTKVHRQPWGES